MASRVSFSKKNLGLDYVHTHHDDVEISLSFYFSGNYQNLPQRYFGYSLKELRDELNERIQEVELSSSMALLAAVEAAFRVDYLQRCYQRDRQEISRQFRQIYKSKRHRVSLDQDILSEWVRFDANLNVLIGELRGALKYRHWIAHGRYWTPKLGRRYDYASVFFLADEIFSTVPFLQE